MEPSPLFAHRARPTPFKCKNEYLVLALEEETAVKAVVGSIVWAFGRLEKPRSRERGCVHTLERSWVHTLWNACTRFIAYAPNFFSSFLSRNLEGIFEMLQWSSILPPSNDNKKRTGSGFFSGSASCVTSSSKTRCKVREQKLHSKLPLRSTVTHSLGWANPFFYSKLRVIQIIS